MKRFILLINKLINMLLIFFIVIIVLNEYYVIEFSNTLKYILYFLTLILILISSTKEILLNKSGLSKFINFIILSLSITGGIFSILTNQISIFIYICILFSLIYGFIDLVYKKS